MSITPLEVRPESIWAQLRAEAEFVRGSGGSVDAVRELAKLIRQGSLRLSLSEESLPEGAMDAGFFGVTVIDGEGRILISEDEFHEALNCALEQATGVFGKIDRERLLEGPSYIELGQWLGDQGIAIGFIGIGAILGFWDVMSPKALGVAGELASGMLEMGFLFPSLKSGSPLIRDGFEEQRK